MQMQNIDVNTNHRCAEDIAESGRHTTVCNRKHHAQARTERSKHIPLCNTYDLAEKNHSATHQEYAKIITLDQDCNMQPY